MPSWGYYNLFGTSDKKIPLIREFNENEGVRKKRLKHLPFKTHYIIFNCHIINIINAITLAFYTQPHLSKNTRINF